MSLKSSLLSSFLLGFGSSVPGGILVSTIQISSFLVNANAEGNLVFAMVINMFVLGIFGVVLPVKVGTSICEKNTAKWSFFIVGFITGLAALLYAVQA